MSLFQGDFPLEINQKNKGKIMKKYQKAEITILSFIQSNDIASLIDDYLTVNDRSTSDITNAENYYVSYSINS